MPQWDICSVSSEEEVREASGTAWHWCLHLQHTQICVSCITQLVKNEKIMWLVLEMKGKKYHLVKHLNVTLHKGNPLSLCPLSSITKKLVILVTSSAEHTPVHDTAILQPYSKLHLLLRRGDVKPKSAACHMQPCFRPRKTELNKTAPYFDSVGSK